MASYPDIDNEKYFPSTRMERLQSDSYGSALVGVPTESTNLSYEARSSDDDDAYASQDSMALMSTRDLMALDKRNADLAIAMDNMHLQPAVPSYPDGLSHAIAGSPSSTRYLPPSASQPALVSSSPPTNLDQFGVSPHHVPSLPPPPYGSPPSIIPSNSISTPNLMNQQLEASGQASSSQRPSCLAPDSQGMHIPLDAKWTRIRRNLVSPEVLARAGVRYEARPDFVAVLGTLTRDEIIEFARRSAEVRNKRKAAAVGARKERRPEDRYYPEKYKNWDVEAANAKGLPNEGYIINSNGRRHSQISASSELYDSSDVSETDTDHYSEDEHDQPPPSYQAHRQSTPYQHSSGNGYEHFQRNRDRGESGVSNVSVSGSSVDEGEKGTKTYPYIVPPPKEDPKESTASPAATSKPKPILKNKDEDPHVRFDPEPHILDEGKSPPRGSSRRHGGGGGGERDKNRDRDRERDRDRDRDGGKKYHSDRYLERDRYVDRDRRERDRYERERERDRERDRDRKYHHSTSSSTPRRDGRSTRKRGSTSDALKAVGIGGAAASLLSVLTEAASGL